MPRGNVRFHKHQFNFWLNGQEHWLIMGQHYEAHESEEDIVKKLRNAAWYRDTRVDIRIYPDRIWVKADAPGRGSSKPVASNCDCDTLIQALTDRVEALEKKLED